MKYKNISDVINSMGNKDSNIVDVESQAGTPIKFGNEILKDENGIPQNHNDGYIKIRYLMPDIGGECTVKFTGGDYHQRMVDYFNKMELVKNFLI